MNINFQSYAMRLQTFMAIITLMHTSNVFS